MVVLQTLGPPFVYNPRSVTQDKFFISPTRFSGFPNSADTTVPDLLTEPIYRAEEAAQEIDMRMKIEEGKGSSLTNLSHLLHIPP